MPGTRETMNIRIQTAVGASSIRRSLALGGLLAFAWAGFAGAATTIDWRFYDFFNVPPGEWWDARLQAYGEAPIGAECFTATGIANGLCTPLQPAVDDLASSPYTHLAGPPIPSGAIYAPFRMEVTGVEVPGYTLAEPVFLPVMNSGESAGSWLDFDWSMQFLDTATALVLDGLGCPNAGIDDGYHVRTQITLASRLKVRLRSFATKLRFVAQTSAALPRIARRRA